MLQLGLWMICPFTLATRAGGGLLTACLRGLFLWVARALVAMGYRLRSIGEITAPAEGGALLVANHVSFIDAAIVSALCPRPVRFVMAASYFKPWWSRWFFQLFQVIPIASAKRDPKGLQRAMGAIDEALAGGDLVMIFPEGRLTTDGELSPFRPGVERILARRPVPVIPCAIRGLWGSRFSRHPGRAPGRGLRPVVEVVWGAPVPGAEASAAGLQAQISDLRGAAQ